MLKKYETPIKGNIVQCIFQTHWEDTKEILRFEGKELRILQFGDWGNKEKRILLKEAQSEKIREFLNENFRRIKVEPKCISTRWSLYVESDLGEHRIWKDSLISMKNAEELSHKLRELLGEKELGLFHACSRAGIKKRVEEEERHRVVKVIFPDSPKEYRYLADEGDYALGDLVRVPVGWENEILEARIEKIEYISKQDLEHFAVKLKKVIVE